MNFRIAFASILTGLIVAGCSSNDSGSPKPGAGGTGSTSGSGAGKGATTSPTGSASDKPGGGAVELIPEMKDFLSQMDGDPDHVEAARDKYAAEGADMSDLPLTPLKDPQVESSESRDGQTCYKVKLKSGQALLTLEICWKDQKIVEVKQLDLKLQ
jgi:hypothetical protein